jgi:hypothetical protein
MADRQQRNSREKKKPKAEKNKTKGQAPTSVFTTNRSSGATSPAPGQGAKKNP